MSKELLPRCDYPEGPPSPSRLLCIPAQLDKLSSIRETNGRESNLRDTNSPGNFYRASYNTEN